MWLKREFSCIASCPVIASIKNGIITHATLREGGEVEIKCRADYTLVGPSKLRCIEGKWNDSLPLCKEPCPDPGLPYQGNRVGDDFRHDKTVTFTCPRDYLMEGVRKITCSDGRWSNETPSCKASCPDPGHPKNGQTIGRVFRHTSVVEFECLGDRLLQGSSQAKCNNGQWNQALPTCRDCGTGLPLGMESRQIPDAFIKASSHRGKHTAHHGRLGGGNYWCSEEGYADFIQIYLPKKYKITGARIHLKSEYKIKAIILKGQIFKQWWNFHYEEPPYNEDEEQIKPIHPFITQSVRIRVLKNIKESICLRAEVYGCGIPKGCIMRGSAVLIKENGRYQPRFVGEYIDVENNLLEVFLPGKKRSMIMNREHMILDEKPSVYDLAIGTLVLGEDATSPGQIREGKIERIANSVCTIKSNDEIWKSDFNKIRIVKISDFCS